jgi:putative chitinase
MEGALSIYPSEVVGAAIHSMEKYNFRTVLQAAILSVISKESGFKTKPEASYAHTSNARIRSNFGSHVASLTEDQLTALKANDVKFFSYVYGGRYGNKPGTNDGWTYRGRGLNDITFLGNYKAVGDIIGVDLVNNPDKLNDPIIAAAAATAYFILFFKAGKASGDLKKKLGVNDVSEITDPQLAVKAVMMANAGWHTDFSTPLIQEGYKKALAAYQSFADSLSHSISSAAKSINDNKGKTIATLFFLGLQHWL